MRFILLALMLSPLASLHADEVSPARPLIGNLSAQKILFLGNSITLHGPAPAIGWTGNWGMAASKQDKDYVHLLTTDITKAVGAQPKTMVKNIAKFEREYTTFDLAKELKPELDFNADIVVVAIGVNIEKVLRKTI
jgi:hypothetical protein